MPTKNRTVGKVLSTSNQDIYTAPARWLANVYSIVITNTTSSVKLVSLEWYDTVNTTWYYIMKDTPVIANGLIQIEEPLYLNVTDKIRGLASVADSITVSVNVREDFAAAL
jgi:hypothetical protein